MIKATGFSIRLSNVSNLTSWGVSSSLLLDEEKDKLMENLSFQ